MTDLVKFLRARFDEDEQAARSTGHLVSGAVFVLDDDYKHETLVMPAGRMLVEVEAKRRIIALHPHTTQREVMGERRLRASYGSHWEKRLKHVDELYCATCHAEDGMISGDGGRPCETLRLLALPYAGHKDYQQTWAM